MLTIYSVPVAVYSAKLHILLRHKGIPFEQLPPPGGYGSDAYRAIVPSGNIPAMIHDGFMLSDSEAIAEYLDEAFPTPPMMPEDIAGRARARELSRFHDTRLEPILRAYFGQVAPDGRNTEFIAENARLLQSRLDQLTVMAWPAPLLTGPTLAIADCGFVASFTILDLLMDCLDLPVQMPDSLADYAAALAAHPSVVDEDARYRAALHDWAAAKGAL